MRTVRVEIQGTTAEEGMAEAFDSLYEMGWTDGLPVIPPSPDRVKATLATVDRRPEEVVAIVPPRQGKATVETIAINAVMAGCRPEYLSSVIAAVEAVTDPQFPLRTLLAGTSTRAPFLLFNGPVRTALGFNCGAGSLGPGWRANSTIGRALNLILFNVGGARPGQYSQNTFSWPQRLSFCTGENEEESPWEPFHVERGYPPEKSTVTAFGVAAQINLISAGCWGEGAEELLSHLGLSMTSLGNAALYNGHAVVLLLLGIDRAKALAAECMTKRDVKEILYRKTQLPASYFPEGFRRCLAEAGRPASDVVSLVDGPHNIHIVVAGGPGSQAIYLPGYFGSPENPNPVTREIPALL